VSASQTALDYERWPFESVRVKILALVPLALFSMACPSSSVVDTDGGPTPSRDGAAGGRDAIANAPDAVPGAPDAEVDPELDAAAARPDANGMVEVCDDVADVNGVISGTINAPRVVLPSSGAPQTKDPIAEASQAARFAITRINGTTLGWHAQVSSITATGDRQEYKHFLVDPVDGAVYAGMQTQISDATAIRFYNADGTLYRELTPNGAPGSNFVGASRQSNFFLVKFSATGAIQWLTRFGPNSNGTRAGELVTIGLVGNNIRVVADVEGSTTIAFAPGTPSEFQQGVPSSTAFWGEIARADGSYVSGSARFIQATDRDSRPIFGGQGHAAHQMNGETAIQARMEKESQPVMETFTIGAGGASPITVTATRSTTAFVKIGANGEPIFAGTLTIPALFGFGGDPRAVALGPNGELVAGGQFPGSESAAFFRGTNGVTRLQTRDQHSYLVAFGTDGALLWVQQIQGMRNAIGRMRVTADAVYVMGSHSEGDRIGALTVPGSGYTLTRHSLATGEAEWVRVFSTLARGSVADAYEVWQDGTDLLVPSIFTGMRVVGGNVDRTFTPFAPVGLHVLRFSPTGDLLGCASLATNARAFQHF